LVCLAGCRSLGGDGNRVRPEVQAANAAFLARLEELRSSTSGDGPPSAELLGIRRLAYEQAPGPSTALHYGLLLGSPEVPGHDARAARPLLKQSVESREGLAAGERALARLALAELDARLSLDDDNRRLAEELATLRDGAATARTSIARRLQAEMDDNARLRRALEEARSKLQKLAALEKSVALGKPAREERKP
jgi:hypothetical protein